MYIHRDTGGDRAYCLSRNLILIHIHSSPQSSPLPTCHIQVLFASLDIFKFMPGCTEAGPDSFLLDSGLCRWDGFPLRGKTLPPMLGFITLRCLLPLPLLLLLLLLSLICYATVINVMQKFRQLSKGMFLVFFIFLAGPPRILVPFGRSPLSLAARIFLLNRFCLLTELQKGHARVD